MAARTPPRFVVRTTIATLVMVAGVLTVVFAGFTINVRDRVRSAVSDKFDAGQRMLSLLEQRRARELASQVATLAENPTLKAAVDTYHAELGGTNPPFRREMLATIARELEKLAVRIEPDVLAVTDPSGTVLAVSGRRTADWPLTRHVEPTRERSGSDYVSLPAGVFQFASAPLQLDDTVIGTLQLAKALDERYVQELSTLSGTATLIASDDHIIASTLPPHLHRSLTPEVLRTLPSRSKIELAGADYAVKLLLPTGDATVYALDSIAASTQVPMQDALRAVFFIALGSFALAGFASVWLARTISRPIDTLSRSLSDMTGARDFDHPLPPTGFSLEVDTLTVAFNTMMQSVSQAEAATEAAYVGAIRALALALDARDPYTAGHSERVSAVSIGIGRQMAPARRSTGDSPPRRPPPRHRQDRHQRRRAAQARAPDAGRVQAHRGAPGRRRPHSAQRALSRSASPDRGAASRTTRRAGISASPPRRRDPAAGAHRSRRRCLRCDDERARVPAGANRS